MIHCIIKWNLLQMQVKFNGLILQSRYFMIPLSRKLKRKVKKPNQDLHRRCCHFKLNSNRGIVHYTVSVMLEATLYSEGERACVVGSIEPVSLIFRRKGRRR